MGRDEKGSWNDSFDDFHFDNEVPWRTRGTDLDLYGKPRRSWSVRRTVLAVTRTAAQTLGLDALLLPLLARLRLAPPIRREDKKVAISRSRTMALLRALIHVLPVGGAVVLVWLNLAGMFVDRGDLFVAGGGLVGGTGSLASWLQYAAKAHELLMVASLCAVVAAYVRAEAALGSGLPFGALFAPLHVGQPQYLWGLEFVGSLWSPDVSRWKRLRMAAVIVPALLLGATLGPASAVAMIPRLARWHGGRSDVYWNASAAQLFPTRMEAVGVDPACANASMLVQSGPACPLAGWEAVLERLLVGGPGGAAAGAGGDGGEMAQSIATTTTSPGGATMTTTTGNVMRLRGPASTRELYRRSFAWSAAPEPGNADYAALANVSHAMNMFTTQSAALADGLVAFGGLWQAATAALLRRRRKSGAILGGGGGGGGAGSQAARFEAVHRIDALAPYASLICNDAYAGAHFNGSAADAAADDGAPIEFFLGDGYANATMLSRGVLYNTTGRRDQTRFAFVDLNDAAFRNVSVGLVMIVPGPEPVNTTQHLLPCVVYAGWGRAQLSLTTMSSGSGGTTTGASSTVPASSDAQDGPSGRTVQSTLSFPQAMDGWSPTLNSSLSRLPLAPIHLSAAWAKYVVPTVLEYGATLPNVLAYSARQAVAASSYAAPPPPSSPSSMSPGGGDGQPATAAASTLGASYYADLLGFATAATVAPDMQALVPLLLALALSNAGATSAVQGLRPDGLSTPRTAADPGAVLQDQDLFFPGASFNNNNNNNTNVTASATTPSSSTPDAAWFRTAATTVRQGFGYGLTSASDPLGTSSPPGGSTQLCAPVLLSMVLLSLYVLLAALHTLYSLISGTSSAAWSSPSSLVALATNSRPTAELQDTCGGICSAGTFGKRVRFVATRGAAAGMAAGGATSARRKVRYTTTSVGVVSGAGPRDHLEMVFAGDEGLVYYGDGRRERGGVERGEEYGRWRGQGDEVYDLLEKGRGGGEGG